MSNISSNFKWAWQAHFFEPQPCNFGKLDIFLRCLNDISTIFWKSLWLQTCQKWQKPVCPGNPGVHWLHWSLKGVRFYLREVAFKRIQYVKMLAMIYWILLSFQAIKIWISQQFFNSKVSDTELNWVASLTLNQIFFVWELYKQLIVKC